MRFMDPVPSTNADRPPREAPSAAVDQAATVAQDRPLPVPGPKPPIADRGWWLLFAGLLMLVVCHPRVWHPSSDGLYFAPLGIGLALIAWLGLRAAIGV